MTIRVRHSGHSRVPFMIKSEHARHKQRCLHPQQSVSQSHHPKSRTRERGRGEREREMRRDSPAIDDDDVRLFVLADHAEARAF